MQQVFCCDAELKTKGIILLLNIICSLVYTKLLWLATTYVQSTVNAEKNGRGDRIWTYALYVPNVALYQTKLHPAIGQ